MHTGLINTWGSNVVQIPLIVLATLITGALKKRCCDRHQRRHVAWRYDMLRQTAASVVGFTMILLISITFDGDDCVNFYTVYATDIVVGFMIEAGMCTAMRRGGYKMGFYGHTPQSNKLQEQAVLCMTLSAMSRCTSGIVAIAVFPYTNQQFDSPHVDTPKGWVYMVVLAPAFYIIIRLLIMDAVYVQPRHYRRVHHVPLNPSVTSAFAVGNVSSDDDVTEQAHSRHAPDGADHDACDQQEENAAKPDSSGEQQD